MIPSCFIYTQTFTLPGFVSITFYSHNKLQTQFDRTHFNVGTMLCWDFISRSRYHRHLPWTLLRLFRRSCSVRTGTDIKGLLTQKYGLTSHDQYWWLYSYLEVLETLNPMLHYSDPIHLVPYDCILCCAVFAVLIVLRTYLFCFCVLFCLLVCTGDQRQTAFQSCLRPLHTLTLKSREREKISLLWIVYAGFSKWYKYPKWALIHCNATKWMNDYCVNAMI